MNGIDEASVDSKLSRDSSADARNGREADFTRALARKETKLVSRLRLIVLFVLCFCALGVALGVYFYVTTSEREQFEIQFFDDSNKLFEAIGKKIDVTKSAMDAMATDLISQSRASNQTWPFVTVNDFALRAAKSLSISGSLLVSVLPVVTNITRAEWEHYSSTNETHLETWVENTIEIQETSKNYNGPSATELHGWEESRVYHDYGVVADDTPLMTPSWQTYPIITSTDYGHPANYDWFPSSEVSEGGNVILKTLEGDSMSISEPYMIPVDDPVQTELNEWWTDWLRLYIAEDEEPMEPISDFFYPIVDSVEHVNPSAVPNREVVGLLAGQQYWRTFFRDVLPEGSDGIDLVFENACTTNFTYRVNGPSETFLGPGNIHDERFEHLKISSTLDSLNEFSSRKSSYLGLPLSDLCPMTLHAYPSQVMFERFSSNNGLIFAFVAVAIFAVTSITFILYDYLVERRQKVVMRTATRTDAIVSSLFPTAVRDKLYPDGDAQPFQNRLNAFLSKEDNEFNNCIPNSPPIADLYPETTVLFADIKGFTYWSSSRAPDQVFTLLETVYGLFDASARRRGVFKVETIGDCYVAVTGLPTPTNDHAVKMARFAKDCLQKMKAVTVELEDTLGEGTADLQIRIGLNSGPTTAGVLRGDKSRFQLFGDTVNTAARMESNSLGGRIMVSESTANLLVESGKQDWLTAQQNTVDVKGKGAMRCYWCFPKASRDEFLETLDLSESEGPSPHVTDVSH